MTAPAGTALTVRATILPYQVIPPGKDWWLWLMVSGRGVGKTWRGSSWIVSQAVKHPGTAWMVIGRTWGEVRRVAAEGPSGIKAFIQRNGLERALLGGKWEKAYQRSFPMELHFANGSTIYFASGDKPDSLRGPDLNGAWVDEGCFIPLESWNVLRPAVRKACPDGTPPRIIFTSTPDGENWVYEQFFKNPPVRGVRYIGGGDLPPATPPSTYDNPFLDDTFKQGLKDTFEGTDFAKQELFGEFLSVSGAIYHLDPLIHSRSGLASVEPDFTWPDGPHQCEEVIAGQDLGTVHDSAFLVLARPKGSMRWCVVEEVVCPAPTEEDWSYAISAAIARWQPRRIWSDSNFPQTTKAQLRRGYPVKHTSKSSESVSDGIREVQRSLSSLRLAVDEEACPVTWRQLKSYRWATDRSGATLIPERPVKKNDDTTDALRYALYGSGVLAKKRLRIIG